MSTVVHDCSSYVHVVHEFPYHHDGSGLVFFPCSWWFNFVHLLHSPCSWWFTLVYSRFFMPNVVHSSYVHGGSCLFCQVFIVFFSMFVMPHACGFIHVHGGSCTLFTSPWCLMFHMFTHVHGGSCMLFHVHGGSCMVFSMFMVVHAWCFPCS